MYGPIKNGSKNKFQAAFDLFAWFNRYMHWILITKLWSNFELFKQRHHNYDYLLFQSSLLQYHRRSLFCSRFKVRRFLERRSFSVAFAILSHVHVAHLQINCGVGWETDYRNMFEFCFVGCIYGNYYLAWFFCFMCVLQLLIGKTGPF